MNSRRPIPLIPAHSASQTRVNALLPGIQTPRSAALGPRNGVPATRASRGAPRGDERSSGARRLIRSPRRRGRAAPSARFAANTANVDDGGFHLRLHSRARGVVDSVQPEHAVVLAAGQLLGGVLIARGPADAIKIHRGVTGTRDHVHAAAVALDRAAQA